MPDLLDYLFRFRRLLIPPGPPGEMVRVPAEPPALDDELQTVFDQIDRIDAERADIDAHADAERARILADARATSADLTDTARRQADDAYAEAYRDRAAALDSRFDDLIKQAKDDAQRVQAEGAPRASALADQIVQSILDDARSRVAAAPKQAG